MSPFLIRFLACASLVPALCSCFPKMLISEYPGEDGTLSVTMSENAQGQESGLEAGPDNVQDGVSEKTPDKQYDFTIKAGKNEISGIMVARREGEATRVIGTTYFGMSLFDMTLTEDSYRMNSCAKFLDNRKIAAFLAMKIRKSPAME